MRLKSKWVTPGYYVTQFLSGHGDFKHKLQFFGLKSSGFCECGELETVEHVLFVCELWENLRNRVECVLRENGMEMNKLALVSEIGFESFAQFAREVLEEKERRELISI